MTNEQKSTIKRMREKLCSYAEIATSLGLSLNSVKSYCLRNHLNTEAIKQNAKRCKHCGKPIFKGSKTKPRVFCCDTCKFAWWKENKSHEHSHLIEDHICLTCGKHFNDYASANRKYCSAKCYQRRNCNG